MSRRELERHRRSLGEIREIMNAMKSLAYMETSKLSRFIDAQKAIVTQIETVAADFVSFHPDLLDWPGPSTRVFLLVGTEHGFCGDINQKLLDEFHRLSSEEQHDSAPLLIVAGRKLEMLLEERKQRAITTSGACVTEEVPAVLQTLVETLTDLQQTHGMLRLTGLYHGGESHVIRRDLLPPFGGLKADPATYGHPPLLNLEPRRFFVDLTDHYLLAALNAMLYTALLAENHHRVMHLDGAVQHLDEEAETLLRRTNALRQEEITEEIEVILLSSESLEH